MDRKTLGMDSNSEKLFIPIAIPTQISLFLNYPQFLCSLSHILLPERNKHMASSTTESALSKFEAKCSGLISSDRATALLETMAALERDFEEFKQRNAQHPGSLLKATYDECVSQPKGQPGLKDFGLVN